MESEHGPVPSAHPAIVRNLPESAAASPMISTSALPTTDQANTRPLKRSRLDSSPNSATGASFADVGLTASPLAKSPRYGTSVSPRVSPAPPVVATAVEDHHRRREEQPKVQGKATVENPGHKAISTLISSANSGKSRPQEHTAATATMSEGMEVVANAISIPSPTQFDDKSENSPASVTSLASLASTAQTATASTTGINPGDGEHRDANGGPNAPPGDKLSTRAFTFPNSGLGRSEGLRDPVRGLSLPMGGLNRHLAPRSSTHKKHKCPYCATEFTRHHNLKSHLLTHSQEKPYVCNTCQMRFRRLHDLKRHSKLHTGERPHICPKCDRKFARGDALARHAKGQGGCAGRRASMGSFGGEDDYDESHLGDDGGMDGVMYAEPPDQNEGDVDDDDRRYSLPSIKTQHVGSNNHGTQDNYPPRVRTPSTYPPAGPRKRQQSGPNYQPTPDHGSPGTAASTSMQTSNISGHGSHTTTTTTTTLSSTATSTNNTNASMMFAQNQMTESPKPISPRAMNALQLGHDGSSSSTSSLNRQRSPSLATQVQQQNFGRRQSERLSSSSTQQPQQSQQGIPPLSSSHGGPKLPALSGLAPPESRYTLPSQASGGAGGGPGQGQGQGQGTTPNGTQTQSQMGFGDGGLGRGGGVHHLHHQQQHQPHQQGGGSGGGVGGDGAGGGGVGGGSSGSGNGGSGGSSSSNNLFSSERGVWTYVQNLEEKVNQLTERVVGMEKVERSREERIRVLMEEVEMLRGVGRG